MAGSGRRGCSPASPVDERRWYLVGAQSSTSPLSRPAHVSVRRFLPGVGWELLSQDSDFFSLSGGAVILMPGKVPAESRWGPRAGGTSSFSVKTQSWSIRHQGAFWAAVRSVPMGALQPGRRHASCPVELGVGASCWTEALVQRPCLVCRDTSVSLVEDP